jgi:hypothetical protein
MSHFRTLSQALQYFTNPLGVWWWTGGTLLAALPWPFIGMEIGSQKLGRVHSGSTPLLNSTANVACFMPLWGLCCNLHHITCGVRTFQQQLQDGAHGREADKLHVAYARQLVRGAGRSICIDMLVWDLCCSCFAPLVDSCCQRHFPCMAGWPARLVGQL